MPKREKEHADNHSASDSEGDAPQAKRPRTEGSAGKKKMTVKEAKIAKIQAEADAFFGASTFEDPMKVKVEDYFVTVAQLFSDKCTKSTDYLHGDRRRDWDWKKVRGILMSRSAESPDTWYMQNRTDSLMKGKFGTDGINVDNFVIAAPSQKTLAPSHFILKDHRSAADIEDNAPERVMALDSQGVKWFPVTKDAAGKEGTNAFILLRVSEVRVWASAAAQTGAGAPGGALEKASSMFGFGGSAPPAPPVAQPQAASASATTFGFGDNTASAPTSATTLPSSGPSFGFSAANAPVSFGFGAAPVAAAAPAAPTSQPSFGFGGPAAAAAAPTPAAIASSASFGFGAPAVSAASGAPATPMLPLPPTTTSSGGMERAMTTFGQGSQEKQLKVADIMWVVWSEGKIKDIRAEHKAGTKIMKKGYPVPAVSADCKVKLLLESDMKDKPTKAADKIVESYFVKNDSDLQEVLTAINDFPSDLERTVELLGAIKAHEIKEAKKDNKEYDELHAKMHPVLLKELEGLVAVRKEEIAKEAAFVDEADALYKAHKLAPRSTVKILKFYPENEIEFRTWGRVSGLLEAGEQAECYPEVFQLQVASSFRKA